MPVKSAAFCRLRLSSVLKYIVEIIFIGAVYDLTKFFGGMSYNANIGYRIRMEVTHGVIYIDAFFMVNFWMDIVLLMITAGISGITTTFRRLSAAAFLGALWASLSIFTGQNQCAAIIMGMVTYLVIGVIMVRITFGRISFGNIIRSYMIMLAAACFLGGLIHLVAYNTMLGYSIMTGVMGNGKIYAAIMICVIPVFFFIRLSRVRQAYGSGLCRVDLKADGNIYRLTGMIDTGNRLKDPVMNQPVHIVNSSAFGRNVPEKFHYIPYHSVGNEHGILPVVFCESMTVYIGEHVKYYNKPEIALYNGKISSDNEYDILLNSEIMK